MHNHQCRYCLDKFLCAEGADECFQRYIVCQTCWWKNDFCHLIFGLALASLAVAMTFFLFAGLTGNTGN